MTHMANIIIIIIQSHLQWLGNTIVVILLWQGLQLATCTQPQTDKTTPSKQDLYGFSGAHLVLHQHT